MFYLRVGPNLFCRAVLLCTLFFAVVRHADAKSEQEAITEGYNAAKNAEVIANSGGEKTLAFESHRLKITIPSGFELSKVAMGSSVGYFISGPKSAQGRASSLKVYVISPPAGAPLPPSKVMFDAMLRPFRMRLANYFEEMTAVQKIHGQTFETARFGGDLAGKNLKGFFYISRLKDAFCIFSGSDDAARFAQSEPQLKAIVNSCKIDAR